MSKMVSQEIIQKISNFSLGEFFFSLDKDSNISRCESFKQKLWIWFNSVCTLAFSFLTLFVVTVLLVVLLLAALLLVVLPLLHQVFLCQQLGVDARLVSQA